MTASFSADIAAWAQKVGLTLDVTVRKVTFDLLERIQQKTPVDTGMLRANYFVGVGVRPDATRDSVDQSEAQTAAMESLKGGKAGDVFYITNNLPYAMAIEMGHSQQAPQGMVRTTAEEFADAVKTALGGA